MKIHNDIRLPAANGFTFSPALQIQKGISLVIVLIALVLMSLSAIGLIRMVDTSNLVTGNLAFKQGTTSVADRGVENALLYFSSGASTTSDNPDSGYYSTSLSALDITGKSDSTNRVIVDWDRDNCAYAASGSFINCIRPSDATTADGYTTRYVITRLCKTTGDVNAVGNTCTRPIVGTGGNPPPKDSPDYSNYVRFGTNSGPYFRIVVRAQGPRNTVSFTETYIHF